MHVIFRKFVTHQIDWLLQARLWVTCSAYGDLTTDIEQLVASVLEYLEEALQAGNVLLFISLHLYPRNPDSTPEER